ncbi:histidine phosphatase family protein [Aureimonas sp. Leaf454]|uniref:histidine phosphatase family protein n=1 Tax=Aureimonas sp. Leaf454 TaxID=1736381 RepID=UPI000ABDBF05|nr:histidine phosphatase family protein [Aureimonas sp. Leaf454]
MKHRLPFIAAVMIACSAVTAPSKAEGTPGWDALSQPQTHILMRHAEAPGVGDPAGFRLGDCATQRNLSAAGREQARRIGEAIKDRGIRVDRILTSQWCRAAETATLLDLGPIVEDAALNSFFDTRETARTQSDEVRRTLSDLDRTGQRATLVTHQVNITSLTGVFPASGEMIVVRMSGNDVEVLARLVPDPTDAREPAVQP